MAALAADEMMRPFGPSVPIEVVNDPVKGRCLVARAAFAVGDTLFTERAFVYGKDDDDVDGDGLPPKVVQLLAQVYSSTVLKDMDEILDELIHLDSVQSMDTARNFLQLVAITELRRRGRLDGTHYGATDLQLLDRLTGHDVASCVDDVRQFRASLPSVLPKALDDETCGRLLAILNTNQLELEMLGGAGLFLRTAICEHSCDPNCSFWTDGIILSMVAIRDINPGDPLSIDYLNLFYRSIPERIESLSASYGFTCVCSMCTGVDRCRAFVCSACKQGLVFPVGPCDGDGNGGSFTACSVCRAPTTAAHRDRCLEREAALLDELARPETVEQMEALLAREADVVHNTHHLFFWLWNDLAMALTSDCNRQGSSSASTNTRSGKGKGLADNIYLPALDAMRRTVALLENMLPTVHHEKIIFFDRQGQLEVSAGLISQARESFRKSYIASKAACGEFASCTAKLKALVDNTPRTVAELRAHYARDTHRMEVDS